MYCQSDYLLHLFLKIFVLKSKIHQGGLFNLWSWNYCRYLVGHICLVTNKALQLFETAFSGNQYQVQSTEGGANTHHGAWGRHPDRQEVKEKARQDWKIHGGGEKNDLYSRNAWKENSRHPYFVYKVLTETVNYRCILCLKIPKAEEMRK